MSSYAEEGGGGDTVVPFGPYLLIRQAVQAPSPDYDAVISVNSSGTTAALQAAASSVTEVRTPAMDDKDVQRLEDRISASEEKSQLRIENFAERIEAAVTRVGDQIGTIRSEVLEQRQDARLLRSEIGQIAANARTELTDYFHWLVGTIVVVAIAAAALIFGGLQIWGNGVQVGQGMQQPSQTAPAHSTTQSKP